MLELSIFNTQFSIIEVVGAAIGLLYIVSEYRADRWFWPLSLLMSAFYIVIDFTSGIYANGAICCYNFVISIYGLLVWRGLLGQRTGTTATTERPITSCPRRYWPWIILAVALLSVLLWFLLKHLPNESQYPVLDGISSALTIVTMWMLSRKWWQQWIGWMLVEPMMIAIFWLTGNYASVVLYVVYEVFCILGILRWYREYRQAS